MIGTYIADVLPTFHLVSRRDGFGGPAPENRPSTPTGRAIRHVAIVEDELVVAWMIESLLEDLGYDVVGIFANGEGAVAALNDLSVDLVCLDINLGRGIDGIEAARQIRERQTTAILFVSAYSDQATRTRIKAALPDAILIGKPPSLTALEDAISGFTSSPS